MSNKVDMNVFLHSLLVIKQMNNFTVLEARDTLLREHSEFTDPSEARKFIYRQLLRAIKSGVLTRTDHFNHGVKKVLYTKNDTFDVSTIVTTNQGYKTKKKYSLMSALEYELKVCEMDLSASIEEAREYKRLSSRFPELIEKLQQHRLQARSKSIVLLGKVHALQRVLGLEVTNNKFF